MKRTVNLYSVLLLFALAACAPREPRPGASVEAYRKYSVGHKWYWARIEGLRTAPSNLLADPPDFYQQKSQAHLRTTNESTHLIYTEIVPSSGLKAFRGPRNLEKIPGNEAPIFSVPGEKVMFIGFFKGRAFRIEISSTSNPDNARQAALDLALAVIRLNQ